MPRKRRPAVLETGGDGFTREVEIDCEESISRQVVVNAWCCNIQSHGGYRSLHVSRGGYPDNIHKYACDIFLGMVPKTI